MILNNLRCFLSDLSECDIHGTIKVVEEVDLSSFLLKYVSRKESITLTHSLFFLITNFEVKTGWAVTDFLGAGSAGLIVTLGCSVTIFFW
jgi:hypothetical protein